MSLVATLFALLAYLLIGAGAAAIQYLYFRFRRREAAPSRSRRALIVLDCFSGVAGLIGMGLLAFGWGYQFPVSWLNGTPFTDYLVPGLILGLVVGGSAFIAMVTTLLSTRIGAITSMIAGVIMIGWIVGEYLLIPQIRFFSDMASNWQQGLMFLVGLGMIVLALRVMSESWRGLLRTAPLT